MEDDLQLARRAAGAGAAVGLRHFAALADLPREVKPDGSVVTAADRAVEAAIREVLTSARPTDAILGEEGGETTGDPGAAAGPQGAAGDPDGGRRERRWIIDPIDGTALFVAGDDRWLVLIALEEDGRVVAAVAVIPAQGRAWWAALGAGAFEAVGDGPPRRITVAPVTDALAASRLGVIAVRPEVAAPLLTVVGEVPWPFHPALMVARGDLDIALQTNGQVWDFAATSLIVTEAGGRYSGLDGRRAPAAGPALYCASVPLHEAALAVLRA